MRQETEMAHTLKRTPWNRRPTLSASTLIANLYFFSIILPILSNITHLLQELVDEVSVCTVDFDTIKARFDGASGGSSIIGDVRHYLWFGERMRDISRADGKGNSEGRDQQLFTLTRTSENAALQLAKRQN